LFSQGGGGKPEKTQVQRERDFFYEKKNRVKKRERGNLKKISAAIKITGKRRDSDK